jgi:excisionase family DNA binding protein
MTLEEVARYLKINKSTVYRLIERRRIPAFKVGNQWRFKKGLVEACLKETRKKH